MQQRKGVVAMAWPFSGVVIYWFSHVKCFRSSKTNLLVVATSLHWEFSYYILFKLALPVDMDDFLCRMKTEGKVYWLVISWVLYDGAFGWRKCGKG